MIKNESGDKMERHDVEVKKRRAKIKEYKRNQNQKHSHSCRYFFKWSTKSYSFPSCWFEITSVVINTQDVKLANIDSRTQKSIAAMQL